MRRSWSVSSVLSKALLEVQKAKEIEKEQEETKEIINQMQRVTERLNAEIEYIKYGLKFVL